MNTPPTEKTADSPVPEPAPSRNLIGLLIATAMIGPMATHLIVPALPAMVQHFRTDAGTAQLAVSLFLAGLGVAQLLYGALSDRFGRRPVLLCGMALTALTAFAAAFSPSIWGVIAARALQSFGSSSGLVLGRAIIRDLYSRERSAAMIAWVTMVMSLSMMLSPLAGGLLDTVFGWKSVFYAMALAGAAVTIWTYFALPETRPAHAKPSGMRQFRNDSRALLRNRAFLGYIAVSALSTAAHFALLGSGPHLVVGLMGLSSATYGAWFTLVALGYIVGNFFTARLASRFGVDRIIVAGLAVMWVGGLLSAVMVGSNPSGGPPILFVPQFFLSVAMGLILPNAIAAAISVLPNAAGTASGITGCAQQSAGAIMAQFMSYLIAGATTPLPLMVVLVLTVLATTAAYFLLVPRAR